MHDGNRGERTKVLEAFLCFVALFGVVILAYATGWTFGSDVGRDQVTAHQHYETAKHNALKACDGRIGSAAVECGAEAAESANDQSIARQDLYAQQDMAKWAFWMLIASTVTLGVSVAGVWFVKRTLDATLVAVGETGKATRAMEAQNALAKDTAERQLRAYISVDGIAAPRIEPSFQGKYVAIIKLVNSGPTPVLNWTIAYCWATSEPNVGKDFYDKSIARYCYVPEGSEMEDRQFAFGPNQSKEIRFEMQLPDELIAKILKRDLRLHLIGFVDYADVFGQERTTKFWYVYNVDIDPVFGQMGWHNQIC